MSNLYTYPFLPKHTNLGIAMTDSDEALSLTPETPIQAILPSMINLSASQAHMVAPQDTSQLVGMLGPVLAAALESTAAATCNHSLMALPCIISMLTLPFGPSAKVELGRDDNLKWQRPILCWTAVVAPSAAGSFPARKTLAQFASVDLPSLCLQWPLCSSCESVAGVTHPQTEARRAPTINVHEFLFSREPARPHPFHSLHVYSSPPSSPHHTLPP